MKDLEILNFKETFIDLTMHSMLNYDNKDLYIENITIETIEKMLNGADNELVECFWTAFKRAHTWVVLEELYYEESIQEEIAFHRSICPDCNCPDYVENIACPNCEYVE